MKTCEKTNSFTFLRQKSDSINHNISKSSEFILCFFSDYKDNMPTLMLGKTQNGSKYKGNSIQMTPSIYGSCN